VLVAVGFGWVLATPSEPAATLAAETKPPPTWPMVIDTMRSGGHHVMRVALIGPNGDTHMLSMVVDTGATSVVMPSTMMNKLGFSEKQLSETAVQTANGVARAWSGRLRSLEIGGPDRSEVIPRVEVVFVDSDALGGVSLLGMNVLSRYNVTFVDSKDQIVLDKRR
jgi:clan AA aspartic protease (TIGR02281 family)